MKIFSKDLNLKDYFCSNDNLYFFKHDTPILNLYVQITGICNASCNFCKRDNICKYFNYEKFDYILKTLSNNIIIGKVAITGGEPLLNFEKTIKVINIARKYADVVTLNTNAFSLKALERVYNLVDYIDISKHHYNNVINDNILKLSTPSLKSIKEIDIDSKISINCVLQKDIIDNYDKVIDFLEYLGYYNIKSAKFISLLPLTNKAIKSYVDPTNIINKCKNFTNSGMLYDHDMCCCFEFLYLSNNYSTIKTIIRHTTNSDYSCIKQFVFNGCYLYDGFKKNTIIY